MELRTPVCGFGILISLAFVTTPHFAQEQKSESRLTIQQFKKYYLRFELPKESQPTDQVFLVHVNPKSKRRPDQLIYAPEGRLEEHIKKLEERAKMLGAEGGLTQTGVQFPNGEFDLSQRNNSHKSIGVYAVAFVVDIVDQEKLGACATYFRLDQWKTGEERVIEIPLPPRADSIRNGYLPENGNVELDLWLVNQNKKRYAHGKITVME